MKTLIFIFIFLLLIKLFYWCTFVDVISMTLFVSFVHILNFSYIFWISYILLFTYLFIYYHNTNSDLSLLTEEDFVSRNCQSNININYILKYMF